MKIAILGASSIAAKIIPVIRTLGDFSLAGVASTDAIRGSTFANANEIPFLGGYSNVYEDKSIEAVYVTTANSMHEACIENALLSGKHVLCEKPLVLNLAASTRLFDLSRTMNLILIEGFMYRFHPQIQELVKRVHSGAFGRPIRINATFSFDYGGGPHVERRFQNGGGALHDLGCYLVDFVSLMSRRAPVKNVQIIEDHGPLSFGAVLYLASGIIAEIRSSMNAPSINTWEVVCERGSLSVNRYNPHDFTESVIRFVNNEGEFRYFPVAQTGSGLEQFACEFQNFYDTVTGNTSPFISPEESIYCSAILELVGSAKKVFP